MENYEEKCSNWQTKSLVDGLGSMAVRERIAKWRPTFSAVPDGEVSYVQHRVWQRRDTVAALFRRGATVFVCGDGARMAPSVRATFVRIYQDALGVSADEAEAWADKVERETGRYVADVFS